MSEEVSATRDEITEQMHYDVVVVGAGFGGLYAVHKMRQDGHTVLGIEGAGGVGGVWYHNRYPGARVDVESIDYCFYFSPELYNEWRWSERYATQPELLRYFNHVADRFDLKRSFRFNTWMTGAQWNPERALYEVSTSNGDVFTCRFLIMATGQLSVSRDPNFAGLANFKGEWVQTSHWPDRHVEYAGKRVAVIGTGSSGIQTIPIVAQKAKHLYVFQRSPNYSVPAWNRKLDEATWNQIRSNVPEKRHWMTRTEASCRLRPARRPASDFSAEEQHQMLEAAWSRGGHCMAGVFSDMGTNRVSNDIVAEFVREKIRALVNDPKIAEKLCPYDHPIGTRRLCVDTDYYITYNRDNVTLVDVKEDPITRITETGIETQGGHYEVDLIIFAIGFHAFTGALKSADIRNEKGEHPSDSWAEGPRTLLGLMTAGFPNLFILSGPGSPSVLANLTLENEYHVDWIADCIAYIERNDFATIEPTLEAQDAWTQHTREISEKILRRQIDNYMVQVNQDGSRIFLPYAGGMTEYTRRADEMANSGYAGFRFGRL